MALTCLHSKGGTRVAALLMTLAALFRQWESLTSGHGTCPLSVLMVVQRMTSDVYRACGYIAGKPETADLVMLVLHKWVGATRMESLLCTVMALDMCCPRSYIRGKPETGDMDMLILPPESAAEIDSALALHELLRILHKRVRAARREDWSKDGKPGCPCAPVVLHELKHILAGAENCGAPPDSLADRRRRHCTSPADPGRGTFAHAGAAAG